MAMLDPDETQRLLLRPHQMTFWPGFLLLLLVAGLPTGFVVGFFVRSGLIHGTGWRYVAGGCVIWTGFWLARAVRDRVHYNRAVWVVTDLRVIDATARSTFGRSFVSVPLQEIIEVRTQGGGPLGALFNYGNVDCWTARGEMLVELIQVPHPREVASHLLQQCQQARSHAASRLLSENEGLASGGRPDDKTESIWRG